MSVNEVISFYSMLTYKYSSSIVKTTTSGGVVIGDYLMDTGIQGENRFVVIQENTPLCAYHPNLLNDMAPFASAPDIAVPDPTVRRKYWNKILNKNLKGNKFLQNLKKLVTSYCFYTIDNQNVNVENIFSFLAREFPDFPVGILQKIYMNISNLNFINIYQLQVDFRSTVYFGIYLFKSNAPMSFTGTLDLNIPAKGTGNPPVNLVMRLITIFITLFQFIPSNEPCSCVSFRIRIWKNPD